MALHLSGDPQADRLLTEDPLALVIGMLLDQQFPMERAFASPAELARRLGVQRLDPGALARMDPERLADLFAERPALHRYPRSMARRVQDLSAVIEERLGGDTAALWTRPQSGRELVDELESLPGFGNRKARIFCALLGKQLGVQPPGWREASEPYGEEGSFRSIADVVSEESLAEVRAVKQTAKQAAKEAGKRAAKAGGDPATR
jgi:uncharacterized HhH-GPD family protein